VDALERFYSEFNRWVSAYNHIKRTSFSPEEVKEKLVSRIPEESLRHIGAAFVEGWLKTVKRKDRGYFVKESDEDTLWGGMWMLEASGEEIIPCWEQYVQLADYSRLRAVADKKGLTVRLEDNLMDIAVCAGENLLLYVENKLKKEDANNLLNKMKEYGEKGFKIDDFDKGNDALRKAKYLVQKNACPSYFVISAIGWEKVFQVEYLHENNRFILHERNDMSLLHPLFDAAISGETP